MSTTKKVATPYTNDDDLGFDYESDRDLNHSLLSRKIKPLYDNSDDSWFTGIITWFNSKMRKVCVVFEDNTDDYVSKDDIDGVEIDLIWYFIFQLS